MPLAQTDLYDVLVALVAAVPATIGAVTTYIVLVHLRTPSGTLIGKQVESAHHTAIANNYRLQAMSGEFDLPVSDRATAEESKAQPPDG